VGSEQDFEVNGITVNVLSRPLQALFCAHSDCAPEDLTELDWCRLAPEVAGACRILYALDLACVAEVDPCKVVQDAEVGQYRPAEPEEIHLAEDGYTLYWEATEVLVPG